MSDEGVLPQPIDPETERALVFQHAMSNASAPLVTYLLIAVNAAVYLAMGISDSKAFLSPSTQQMIAWGADYGPLSLHGQWWRAISACFLHFGFLHLLMNMLVLIQAGPFAEKLFGRLRYLVLYLLSGIGGNIAGLYVHPISVAAGASGAVFGVYGGLVGFMIAERGSMPRGSVVAVLKSASIFVVINLFYGLRNISTVDMTAHFGGLLSGLLAGLFLARPLLPEGPKPHLVRAITVAGAGVVLWIAGFAALGSHAMTPREALNDRLATSPSVEMGNNDTVSYSGGATEAEARKLGEALKKEGFFGQSNRGVLYSRADGIPTMSLMLKTDDPLKPGDGSAPKTGFDKPLVPYPWDDPEFLGSIRLMGASVAPSVGGPPFRIALINNGGVTEKVLSIDDRIALFSGNDRILYSGSATAEDAQALGKAMAAAGVFRGSGATFLLSRDGTGTDVSLVVKDGTWNAPKAVAYFQLIGHKIGASLGNRPIRLHLSDRNLIVQKDIPNK